MTSLLQKTHIKSDWNAVNKTCYAEGSRNEAKHLRCVIEFRRRRPWSVLPPKQRSFCPPGGRHKTSTNEITPNLALSENTPIRLKGTECFNILSVISSSTIHGHAIVYLVTLGRVSTFLVQQSWLRVCPYVGERKLQPHPRIMLPSKKTCEKK